MTTNQQVVERWFRDVTKANPEFIGTRHSNNVFAGTRDGRRQLYSWGTHFSLVELVTCRQGDYFLINGDTFSNSTTRHQWIVRRVADKHPLPTIIIPFSALDSAMIDHGSIVPTFIEKDRTDKIPHESADFSDVPNHLQKYWDSEKNEYMPIAADADGMFRWTTDEHFLGASGFRAVWKERRGNPDGTDKNRIGYFLSAFDEGEPGRSYFLCQLPRKADSYAQALELLKPEEVLLADLRDDPWVRQGDIFAIPTGLVMPKGTEVKKMGRLLGTSHVATEMVEIDGMTYARGILWHKPSFGAAPEHVRKVLGDRKTWHRIVQNTVPKDGMTGQPRGWQITGRVD